MKSIKTVDKLLESPFYFVPLTFNNFRVIEFCAHIRENIDCRGSMFLDDHVIYYIHKGKIIFAYGNQTFEVKAGELIVLPRATSIAYDKSSGEEVNFDYQCIMFYLKDAFITDFLKMAKIKPAYSLTTKSDTSQDNMVAIERKAKPVKERLMKFFESLMPYFDEPNMIEEELVRLKMLELLYDIAHLDNNFLPQILQLHKQSINDLNYVLENNYTKAISLNDLATLSGRSLSSFKREFQQVYNTSPKKWIKEKRLNKAKELLTHSNKSVTDVCFTTGFENVAHFSREFKKRFGVQPSQIKSRLS